MRHRKTAYELSGSQVDTPLGIVDVFWKIVRRYRSTLSRVLDLGAGDCRFAYNSIAQKYTGIEIDFARADTAKLSNSDDLEIGCAFEHKIEGYSACIGNPPYVRHHDLEPDWRDGIVSKMSEEFDVPINRKSNLYVLFMFLSILKTSDRGLIALIVPFEWVSRPSTAGLRDLIKRAKWQTHVYRFQSPIFSNVDTTASITIINKRVRDGSLNYYSIDPIGCFSPLPTPTGTKRSVLEYSDRGNIWAMRGLSPGTQEVFTLSEGERVHNGLTGEDVYPCVTSMRQLPDHVRKLDKSAFVKWYVNSGAKCWLIKSDQKTVSPRLEAYLATISANARNTWTCNQRDVWYRYSKAEVPALLLSSGFVGKAPKVVVNAVRAQPVGVVHGVHSGCKFDCVDLREYLAKFNFRDRIVPHSGNLRKVEIRQLNSILDKWANRRGKAKAG